MASLDYAGISIQTAWRLSKDITGYDDATYSGAKGKTPSLTVTGGSAANRIYFVTGTLTSGSTDVINLQSITDALGEAIVATRAFGVRVEWTGNGLTYAPDASQGFVGPVTTSLIFSGTSGVFGYCMTTHDTVDGTHRRIALTNNNSLGTAASLTYKIEIILGQ